MFWDGDYEWDHVPILYVFQVDEVVERILRRGHKMESMGVEEDVIARHEYDVWVLVVQNKSAVEGRGHRVRGLWLMLLRMRGYAQKRVALRIDVSQFRGFEYEVTIRTDGRGSLDLNGSELSLIG